MQIENLIESFSEFKDIKNIDRETMMNILEDVFKSVLFKKYEGAENFDIIINIDKGDLEIWRNRVVVTDAKYENSNTEIKLSDALKIEDDYEVGEDVSEQIDFDKEFGRRQILSIRQHLLIKINELHRDELIKRYSDRIGEIVTGEVYQIWRNELLLHDDEGNDLVIPKSQQIPKDFFKKGDTVRAVVTGVEERGSKANIILSRTAPEFVERLFELEVPEVFDGIITIKKVVRVPGERAKVAVESYDDRIDPVGACVGMKGSRIHGIVRELRNENIDVINFTENTQLLINRSLSPAKISSVKIDYDNKKETELSLLEKINIEKFNKKLNKNGMDIDLNKTKLSLEILSKKLNWMSKFDRKRIFEQNY